MSGSVRLVITGGRKFSDAHLLTECLDSLVRGWGLHVECLIHGDCAGADRLGGEWARLRGIPEQKYPITDEDWKTYGKAAGPLRNQQMIDDGKPHFGVAFPGGDGTRDMVDRLIAANIPVCTAQWEARTRILDPANVVYPERL